MSTEQSPTPPSTSTENYEFRVPHHDLDLTPVNGPHATGVLRRVAAQGTYEGRTTLSNGEQLLVAIILPLMVLVALAVTGFMDEPGGPATIDLATPGILALAVLSSGLTGQGIATGFDRRYGVLKYLATTPLGPGGLLLGKTLAVLLVLVVQFIVIGMVAIALDWLPNAIGILYGGLFMFVGALTFTALGLLIAGTVRPEGTLAITNLLWVILGAAGGVVFPLGESWFATIAHFLPSAALGDGLRAAMIHGQFDLGALVILALWGIVLSLCTVRWFKWR